MAAGENEPKFVVVDFGRLLLAGVRLLVQCQFAQRGVEAGSASPSVDRFEASRGDEPRVGVARLTVDRPAFGGGDAGVVQRFFGGVEIAE